MEKRFHNKIIYISFILSVMVVSAHAFNIDVYQIRESQIFGAQTLLKVENYIRWTETGIVPFFYMISGYLFFRNYSWDKVFRKYKSRFFSLFVPYVLWCSIWFFVYAIITRIPGIGSRLNSIEKVTLSIPSYLSSVSTSNYTVLWFIRIVIAQVVISPIVFLLIGNKQNKIMRVFSWIIYLFAMLCLFHVIPINIPVVNLYYLTGSFLALQLPGVVEKPNLIVKIIATILLSIFLLYGVTHSMMVSEFLVLCFDASIWFTLEWIPNFKEPKWWMNISFFIYCTPPVRRIKYSLKPEPVGFTLRTWSVILLEVICVKLVSELSVRDE